MKKLVIIITLCILTVSIIIICIFLGKKDTYKVSFIVDGKDYAIIKVSKGDTITNIDDPKKEGYEFLGWYNSKIKYNLKNKVYSDLTLEAKWTKKDKTQTIKYKVIFNYDNGTKNIIKKITENNTVNKPTDPVKEGYKFLGWYLDDKEYDFNSLIDKDIILVAKWEKEIKDESVCLATKEVEEIVNIEYDTVYQEEVNMKKGKEKIIQEPSIGQKKIKYLISYDSKGNIISKDIINETIIKKPVNKIVSKGISDFNLNEDKKTEWTRGEYCLNSEIRDVTGNGDYICVTSNPYKGWTGILINNTWYLTSIGNTNNYNEMTDVRPIIKLHTSLVYPLCYEGNLNNINYYFCKNYGGGFDEVNLTYEDCNTYNLSCGRW